MIKVEDLREMREKASITIKELSLKTNVPCRTLYNWELGSCHPASPSYYMVSEYIETKLKLQTDSKVLQLERRIALLEQKLSRALSIMAKKGLLCLIMN